MKRKRIFKKREFPRVALRAEAAVLDRPGKGYLKLLLAFGEPAREEVFILCGMFSDCNGKPPR